MTTGDIKNNVRKLTAALKGIKYEGVNVESLSKGLAASYLPIYHYVFRDYSRHLAEQIAEIKVELFGKSDARFVESMYKLLRELFSYKPPLTKEQFFANGFVERKIIMCTEILNLARQRHKSLAPKTVKQRPASENLSFRGSKIDSTKPAVQSAPTQPSKSTLKVQSSVSAPLDKSLSNNATVQRAPLDKSLSNNASVQPSKVYTPVMGESSVAPYNPSFYQSSHIESGLSQSNSCEGHRARSSSIVEVVSLKQQVPRVIRQTASAVTKEEQLRPIDVVAMTPRKPSGKAIDSIQFDENAKLQSNNRAKHFHEFNERLVSIENRLSKLEGLSRMEEQEQENETILARLTLLENWFQLQNKSQPASKHDIISDSPVCNDASQTQAAAPADGPTTSTPTKTKPPVNDSDMSELPPGLVRRMEEKLDELLKSKLSQQEISSKLTGVNSDTACPSKEAAEEVESTEPVIPEVSNGINVPAAEDHTQAERIKQMFKETENLLNIAVDSPLPAKKHGLTPTDI